MTSRPSKPMTELPDPNLVTDFDVVKLLDHCGEILNREIKNLLSLSSRGKLEKADAGDLVNYVRLLSEIRDRQLKDLASLTDEELKSI